MRTDIFNGFPNFTTEFREDFLTLWALSPEARKKLASYVPKIIRARTVGDSRKITESAVKEARGSSDKNLKAFKLLRFIYGAWSPVRDTPEGFLRDIHDLNLVPEEKADEAKDFLLEFLALIEEDNPYRLEKSAAGSMLPNYSGCTAIVDFRAVFRNPYEYIEEADINKYEPRCISFTPVVILELRRDKGDPTAFCFQCEEDTLQKLVDALAAAAKDLDAAKASLPKEAK